MKLDFPVPDSPGVAKAHSPNFWTASVPFQDVDIVGACQGGYNAGYRLIASYRVQTPQIAAVTWFGLFEKGLSSAPKK